MKKEGKSPRKPSAKKITVDRPGLHHRNRFNGRYDFPALISEFPALEPFVRPNPFGELSVDFFDPEAVRMLNAALLFQAYGLREWKLPSGYLCPPVPGRADYIHHVADLLASAAGAEIPRGSKIRCLDIGTGASCIYPVLGHAEYGWHWVASDIDQQSLDNCSMILQANPAFGEAIEMRKQTDPKSIFKGIVQPGDHFDACLCNPPFFTGPEEAATASNKKSFNLRGKQTTSVQRNFGGQAAELWCEGGEGKFVSAMVRESIAYAKNIRWFSSLVSKESNLEGIRRALRNIQPKQVKEIRMGQGSKVSRIVAWTFY